MRALTTQPASELARQIQDIEVSVTDVVRAHLDEIGKKNPRLNAFVHVDAEGAMKRATLADQQLEESGRTGPLHGIPVSIKSSIDVAGFPCECGTKLRAGRVAERDAPLIQRLKAAGAIILGNTNVPEMLMAWETDNALYGRTNNPWDLSRTAGGSSGGESAAIASGCSAGGIGSDGGGSIRVPAHFTGICGLKPTPGRIPATGHFPASLGPFALLGVVGPMARTIDDLQLLFEVLAGPDDGDPGAAPVPVRFPLSFPLKRTRIGYFEDDGRTPVTPETRAAVRKAADSLTQQGFDVREFRPEGLERARAAWWQLFGMAGDVLLNPMLQDHEQELSPTLRDFRRIVRAGIPLTLNSFMEALIERDLVRGRLLEQMRDYPVLICPVAAVPAFRHGERKWTVEGREVEYLDAWSYSEWFNLTGNPSVVVPVGKSPEGLPIGVQIVGRPFQEELILSIARIVERSCGGFSPPPE